MNATAKKIVRPTYVLKQLMNAMQDRVPVSVMKEDGSYHRGVINGISIEDGSGKNWMIKFNNYPREIFVKAE